MNNSNNTSARIIHQIRDISPDTWNLCANPAHLPHNPFISHAFLNALEISGSASAETGWRPCHLILEMGRQVLGVVPMYLKNHSQGEYVFDHNWADAWHRAGGHYYPKLQVSVPFTPATGRRLLTIQPINADESTSYETELLLLKACQQVTEQFDASSLHITFMPKDQWDIAQQANYLGRIDQQFHWLNPGYRSFSEFLGDLASKKRKNLKRERREALQAGVEIEWLTGSDLTESHWDAFFEFYTDTGSRKWGIPYLTREFFSLIGSTMADDILLILCRRGDRYIAGALNFIGGDALYGRNWGCTEHHPFLHFETCYYQAIDFAIERGLQRVEAGAQGGHKVARGYRPVATYSAHFIQDEGFRQAIARYLKEERSYIADNIAYVEQHLPFKSGIDINITSPGPASQR